jgi:hypothetical protein
MNEDERILREVERDILDDFHMRYPLLSRNANGAIAAVLRVFVDLLRELNTGAIPKDTEHAKEKTANEGFRGIAHCLRWIRICCPRLNTVPNPGEKVLLAEARDLLRWGVSFDALYNQHTAYSRRIRGKRLVEAKVDNENKTITFLPQQVDPRFFISQVEAQRAENARQSVAYPDADLSKLSKPWFDSTRPGRAGIRFDDTKIVSSGALQIAVDWLSTTCLPDLSDNRSLGEFSVGGLRHVLAAIHVASLFRVRREDVSDSHRGPVLSHVLTLRWHDLIEWIHRLSEVSRPEISAIISLLTFDNEPERVTLAHKPFVLGCDEQVYFAPRLFLDLNLSHMVVGAMNLTPRGRSQYNAVSNQITSSFTQDVAARIKVGCLSDAQSVSERTFQVPNEVPITPDIVLMSRDAGQLLVVDVKSSFPPFGVGYIHEDLLELEKENDGWKAKMKRYISVFKNVPQILSQHFDVNGKAAPNVYGLFVLRWPFPIPTEFGEGIGAIDWPTLLEELNRGDGRRSFRELHNWICERPDVSVVRNLVWTEKRVLVDDWTYGYSVLAVGNRFD